VLLLALLLLPLLPLLLLLLLTLYLASGRPKALFLDEPSSGLDVSTRRFLWNFIKYEYCD
jgi:ATPase subunit of ABC transporter with duplicated ATPase domains